MFWPSFGSEIYLCPEVGVGWVVKASPVAWRLNEPLGLTYSITGEAFAKSDDFAKAARFFAIFGENGSI
ncbi:unnamed protein product [Phytomonas sp. Hart1]|nr:unnamed protein product [Phytomonas sp. Hart1]|eukprot:CCW72201.1 unnamed protein product [Phytomonas sp. isolate Hart1]